MPDYRAERYAMIEFNVPDMTCQHCVATLSQALRAIAPAERVAIDLARKRVRVDGDVPADTVARAIRDAGYAPEKVT